MPPSPTHFLRIDIAEPPCDMRIVIQVIRVCTDDQLFMQEVGGAGRVEFVQSVLR